jgi:hypothetical protein
MQQKVFAPSYKVHRHGGGLYSFSFSTRKKSGLQYINRIKIGCRNFYHVSKSLPLFPTLRDAVMHIVYGG